MRSASFPLSPAPPVTLRTVRSRLSTALSRKGGCVTWHRAMSTGNRCQSTICENESQRTSRRSVSALGTDLTTFAPQASWDKRSIYRNNADYRKPRPLRVEMIDAASQRLTLRHKFRRVSYYEESNICHFFGRYFGARSQFLRVLPPFLFQRRSARFTVFPSAIPAAGASR